MICDQCRLDKTKTSRTVILTAEGQYGVVLCDECALTINSTAVRERARTLGRIEKAGTGRQAPQPGPAGIIQQQQDGMETGVPGTLEDLRAGAGNIP